MWPLLQSGLLDALPPCRQPGSRLPPTLPAIALSSPHQPTGVSTQTLHHHTGSQTARTLPAGEPRKYSLHVYSHPPLPSRADSTRQHLGDGANRMAAGRVARGLAEPAASREASRWQALLLLSYCFS